MAYINLVCLYIILVHLNKCRVLADVYFPRAVVLAGEVLRFSGCLDRVNPVDSILCRSGGFLQWLGILRPFSLKRSIRQRVDDCSFLASASSNRSLTMLSLFYQRDC